MLGLTDIGLERDPAACAVRRAAGHATVRCDLATYPLRPDFPLTGYIASPPCQSFSAAGAGEGRDVVPSMVEAVTAGSHELDTDHRTQHVLRVAHDVDCLGPEWIVLEQVPSALAVWQAVACRLDARGYSTWAGVLNAADYGVPQTRQRTFLLASRERLVCPPEPTHARHAAASLFGSTLPWVSMAEAVGWHGTLDRRQRDRDRPVRRVPTSEPAPTLTRFAASSQWIVYHDDAEPEHVTPTAGLVLQSFRDDYPLVGTEPVRSLHIGNAMPPLLAAHLLAAVTGRVISASPRGITDESVLHDPATALARRAGPADRPASQVRGHAP
jgi:DNA (cytosine-5)-methyltransferase 1